MDYTDKVPTMQIPTRSRSVWAASRARQGGHIGGAGGVLAIAVRDRIKSPVTRIIVKPDGSVIVEGTYDTYEPLVREELERTPANGAVGEAGEKVRTTWCRGSGPHILRTPESGAS